MRIEIRGEELKWTCQDAKQKDYSPSEACSLLTAAKDRTAGHSKAQEDLCHKQAAQMN